MVRQPLSTAARVFPRRNSIGIPQDGPRERYSRTRRVGGKLWLRVKATGTGLSSYHNGDGVEIDRRSSRVFGPLLATTPRIQLPLDDCGGRRFLCVSAHRVGPKLRAPLVRRPQPSQLHSRPSGIDSRLSRGWRSDMAGEHQQGNTALRRDRCDLRRVDPGDCDCRFRAHIRQSHRCGVCNYAGSFPFTLRRSDAIAQTIV